MYTQQVVAAKTTFRVGLTSDGLGKAFITAWLLTGSQARAEDAVAEGFCLSLDGESPLQDSVAAVALRMGEGAVDPGGELGLPRELRFVLRLRPDRRRCYVLRVLAGYSREASARLLGMSAFEVDQQVAASMQALAFEGAKGSRTWRTELTQAGPRPRV